MSVLHPWLPNSKLKWSTGCKTGQHTRFVSENRSWGTTVRPTGSWMTVHGATSTRHVPWESCLLIFFLGASLKHQTFESGLILSIQTSSGSALLHFSHRSTPQCHSNEKFPKTTVGSQLFRGLVGQSECDERFLGETTARNKNATHKKRVVHGNVRSS